MDTCKEKDMNSEFSVDGRMVTVFKADNPCSPAVYLNSYDDEEGEKVWQELKNSSVDVNLIVISSLDWNCDMSPYSAPSVFRHAPDFSGGAAKYLGLLTENIIPAAEEITGPVEWRGIAGYSLAGLFALYSLFMTDAFSRCASVSGSLWYPGFSSFAAQHEMMVRPQCIYFSLGDRECRTRNPVLCTVQSETENIAALVERRGIPAVFRLNEGGHLDNPALRMADGLRWITSFRP